MNRGNIFFEIRNGLTGGSSDDLDGEPTIRLLPEFSQIRFVIVNGGTTLWQLNSGTDASSDTVVRPRDYNALTNAKVWKRVMTSGGAGAGDIISSTSILTDTQIKSLPTIPAQLIPAPGSGKWISIIQMMLTSHFEGGAYTGMGDGDSVSTNTSSAALNDVANSATTLTDFFGNTFGTSNLLILRPFIYACEPIATGRGIVEEPGATHFYDNVALTLFVIQGGAPGNWGGGNPANTLKVKTIYTIEDI